MPPQADRSTPAAPRLLASFRVRVGVATVSVVVLVSLVAWLASYQQVRSALASQADQATIERRASAAAWRTSLIVATFGLPLSLIVAMAVVRAPVRAVHDLRRFLGRLPEAVGEQVALRGHSGAWRDTLAALNRASDLLATQHRELERVSAENQRFVSIAQHSSLGLVVTDRHGVIEWVNVGFERLTGFGIDAARGHTPRALLNSVGAEPETLSSMARAVRDGTGFEADILAHTASGRRRWLRVAAAPVRDEHGQVTGYMSIHSAADDRMEALRALQRSQQLSQAVAEFSTRMLLAERWSDAVDDALTQIVTVAGAAQACIYTIEPISQRASQRAARPTTSDGISTPRLPAAFDASTLREGLGTRRVLHADVLGEHDSPSFSDPSTGVIAIFPLVVDQALWGVVVFDGGVGAPPWQSADLSAFMTVSDAIAAAIERASSEEALARERSFAHAVLAGIVDGVVVSDAEGTIVYANPALLRMLDRSQHEVVGQPLHAFHLRGTSDTADAGTYDGDSLTYEVTIAAGTGVRTLEARRSSDSQSDSSYGLITVLTDVTHARALRRDLNRALAAAEGASEAKSRFLGRVSHELRTPLNAIGGFAQLAAFDAEDPELLDALQQIQRASTHLDRLISDLLDVTSAETGDLRVALERVDLEDVVRAAADLVRASAANAALDLELDLRSGTYVYADAGRVTQVVLNLLSNAVKFAPGGSSVAVRVLRDEERGVGRIEVQDHGPGIAPQDQERIFRPFERLENARDRDGSGIGLALSRVLTERMGGRLGVDSSEGAGACFWTEYPLEPLSFVQKVDVRAH